MLLKHMILTIGLGVYFLTALSLPASSVKELLEKTTSKETLERWKSYPGFFEKEVARCEKNIASFCEGELKILVGLRSVSRWGLSTTVPFSEDNLNEVIFWKKKIDLISKPGLDVMKFQYTVNGIFGCFIMSEETPLEAIQNKILPLLNADLERVAKEMQAVSQKDARLVTAEEEGKFEIAKGMQTVFRGNIFAANVRLAKAEDAVKLLTEEIKQGGKYESEAMKMASLLATPELIAVLEASKNKDKKVFVEIAKLNAELRSKSKPIKDVYSSAVSNRALEDSTRIYAMRKFIQADDLWSIASVLETYKSQQSEMSDSLKIEFYDAIRTFEGYPDIKEKLKKLNIESR